MKKTVDYLMSNKYSIIVFAVVIFGLKLLFDYYDIPEKYLPWFNTLKTVFLIVFIAAIVHFFSLFVIAWATRNQSEHWWEEKRRRGEKLLNGYTKVLIVTLPIVIYGGLLYFAVFASWRDILVYASILTISRFINQLQSNKRQQVHR